MDLQRKQQFEDLYQCNQREVWSLAYARLRNADSAQDVMQEAFCRLWKQWSDGGIVLHPRAWLLRTAHNLAEDWAKNSFLRNGTQSPEIMDAVRSREPLPLESLEHDEVFQKVYEALNHLPDDYRDVWTRHHIEQQPRDEIGSHTGRSTLAVKAILQRANRLLRQLLDGMRPDRLARRRRCRRNHAT